MPIDPRELVRAIGLAPAYLETEGERRLRLEQEGPQGPPDGGSCGECGSGLPSWQTDGSLCGRCEDEIRREATEAAMAAELR
jgi:hypothetical protein